MTFVEFAEKMYGSERNPFQKEQLLRYEDMINQGYEIIMPPPRSAKSFNWNLALLVEEYKSEVRKLEIGEQINNKAKKLKPVEIGNPNDRIDVYTGGDFCDNGITQQIRDNASKIAFLLCCKGQHVELCENKDGLRIVAMDRKVVK